MQNTLGKRVDEEREEKSRNHFTIRKPSRQATQQNDIFCVETVHTCTLLASHDTSTLLLLATTSAHATPCYCSSSFATPHQIDVSLGAVDILEPSRGSRHKDGDDVGVPLMSS